MAKYSDIKGFTVQTVSTDPAASAITAASWASGEDLSRGAGIGLAGSGASGTAIMGVGGVTGGPPYVTQDKTERYNGTSWTEVADTVAARDNATSSHNSPYDSSLYFGGTPPGTGVNLTESWNGSAWTEVAELTTPRGSAAGAGESNTSALCFTGESPEGGGSGPHSARAEEWDGSSWTETGDLSQGRREAGGTGVKDAALCIGGSEDPPAHINKVEEWNGSAWTEIAEINTARNENNTSGTVTSALTFGGRTPSKTANTEHWNGTAWTEVNNLSTARSDTFTGGGTATSTIMAGGETGSGYVATTEEWTAPSVFGQQIQGQLFFNSTTNTFKETLLDVPGATWASVTNINSPRGSFQTTGAGTSTEGIVFGGLQPSLTGKTEDWDGSSWTEKGDLNDPTRDGGGTGSYNSALSGGGDPGGVTDNAETWNGSSWTAITEMGQAREGLGMAGTSNSAVIAFAGGPTTDSQLWNGSSWTEIADVNNPRKFGAGVGSSTSAVYYGGQDPGQTGKTEEWNGSAWSEQSDLNTVRASLGGSGTSKDDALAFGGFAPAPSKKNETEKWNGTTWTELNNLGTARNGGGAAGQSSTGAIYAGGDIATGYTAAAEEFTTSIANKTITTS